MPATTQINISEFDELQNSMYDSAKKYLPVGVDILDTHVYGKQLKGLLNTISPDYNPENVFNLEILEGFPVAVYGFTVALNKEGIPSLLFGNRESTPNEFPIMVSIDEDGDATYQVGGAYIEFEQDSKNQSIKAFVGYKKIRCSARLLIAESLVFTQLEKANTVEKLAACLEVIPSGSGSYGFRLKDLANPLVVEQKQVKFPLILNIDSIDETYKGDGFLSTNLNVSSSDGNPIWGVKKEETTPTEVAKVSVTSSSPTAGSLCTEVGAARFLLCKLFGGIARLVIVQPNKNPEYNPRHVLQLLPPENPTIAAGYQKAKAKLVEALENGESYMDLLSEASVRKFCETDNAPSSIEGAQVTTPVATPAAAPVVEAHIPF